MLRHSLVIAIGLVPALAAGEPRPEDALPVITAAEAKLAKIKSLQYTMRNHAIRIDAESLLDDRTTTRIIAQRAARTLRVRSETTDAVRYHCKHSGCDDASSNDDSTALHVFDGRVFHAHTKILGLQSVTRQTTDTAPLFTLLEIGVVFDPIGRVTIARAPDVVIGGKVVRVIVRTIDDESTTFYYLDGDTGLIRTEVHIDGPNLIVTSYTDVKVDAAVPASAFVFVPPAGVRASNLD